MLLSLKNAVGAITQTSLELEMGCQRFNWKGSVGGSIVEIEIESAIFDSKKFKFEKAQPIDTVDGHPCLETSFLDNNKTHINRMSVKWSGKDLNLKRGAYTSMFKPRLDAGKDDVPSNEFDTENVRIYRGDDNQAIFVTVPTVASAQFWVAGFIITKTGYISRFTIIHTL